MTNINNDRAMKLLRDLKEWEEECKLAFDSFETADSDKMKRIIAHSIRAYFLDFHILCEDFISIHLKLLNKFKIDLSAIEGMEILKDEGVISEVFYTFYTGSRRLRNRLAHRYKLPSDEQLIDNMKNKSDLIVELKNGLKKLLIDNQPSA